MKITILTPFPGTQIYAEALQRGIIRSDVWRDFARAPDPDFEPPHWGEFFTRAQLAEMLVRGYRSFYLRPSYVLGRFVKLRSWNQLRKNARAALRLVGMK